MASAAQAQAAPAGGSTDEETKRLAQQKRAEKARRKQALQLQRESILSQRTSNAGRRAALEAALKVIESELAALE